MKINHDNILKELRPPKKKEKQNEKQNKKGRATWKKEIKKQSKIIGKNKNRKNM